VTPDEIAACLDAGRLTTAQANRWLEMAADHRRIAAWNRKAIGLLAKELEDRRDGLLPGSLPPAEE
jgi:hypothetical protein